jgi:two-component system chemotaxis response regulator CheB
LRTVLVVDDEKSMLKLITKVLRPYADRFNLLTALDGEQALDRLAQNRVDMVLTDLRMPVMDGIELLSRMGNLYPHIPAVVMTAFNTREIENRLINEHLVTVVEKPFENDQIITAVHDTLKALDDKSTVKGISLSNFLQLIKWEEKSCLLEVVTGQGEKGCVYAQHGQLHDAMFQGLKGEQAAYAMLVLDELSIHTHPLPRRKIRRRIHQDLMHILMEGARLKDELAGQPVAADANSVSPSAADGTARQPVCRETSTSQEITVLVVDDSVVMRRAITGFFEGCDGISIIGEAENGTDAVMLNESLCPDVITLDICMPIMNGLRALKHIMVRQPTPVVMLSTLTRDGAWETFEALRLGAVDFVAKPSRMQATKIDGQLQQLAAKVRLAGGANGPALQMLRPSAAKNQPCNPEPWQPGNRLIAAAAAEGGYRALLSLLGELDLKRSSAMVTVLKSDPAHLDAFAAYLGGFSRVPVYRPQAGLVVRTGGCCLLSAFESFAVVRQDGAFRFEARRPDTDDGGAPMDRQLSNLADTFGDDTVGLLLSGDDGDGIRGLAAVRSAGGSTLAPDPDHCLFAATLRDAIQQGLVDEIVAANLGRALSDE